MRNRESRNRSIGSSGTPVLVTDTAVLTESDSVQDMQKREGDVVLGLRLGLAVSAAIWLTIIFAGFLLFG